MPDFLQEEALNKSQQNLPIVLLWALAFHSLVGNWSSPIIYPSCLLLGSLHACCEGEGLNEEDSSYPPPLFFRRLTMNNWSIMIAKTLITTVGRVAHWFGFAEPYSRIIFYIFAYKIETPI